MVASRKLIAASIACVVAAVIASIYMDWGDGALGDAGLGVGEKIQDSTIGRFESQDENPVRESAAENAAVTVRVVGENASLVPAWCQTIGPDGESLEVTHSADGSFHFQGSKEGVVFGSDGYVTSQPTKISGEGIRTVTLRRGRQVLFRAQTPQGVPVDGVAVCVSSVGRPLSQGGGFDPNSIGLRSVDRIMQTMTTSSGGLCTVSGLPEGKLYYAASKKGYAMMSVGAVSAGVGEVDVILREVHAFAVGCVADQIIRWRVLDWGDCNPTAGMSRQLTMEKVKLQESFKLRGLDMVVETFECTGTNTYVTLEIYLARSGLGIYYVPVQSLSSLTPYYIDPGKASTQKLGRVQVGFIGSDGSRMNVPSGPFYILGTEEGNLVRYPVLPDVELSVPAGMYRITSDSGFADGCLVEPQSFEVKAGHLSSIQQELSGAPSKVTIRARDAYGGVVGTMNLAIHNSSNRMQGSLADRDQWSGWFTQGDEVRYYVGGLRGSAQSTFVPAEPDMVIDVVLRKVR